MSFAVDAALLFQLGEELVNKRSVALGELIKNAYDADATKVILTFRNIKTKDGEIEIADNGTGLTFPQLRDAWMRIATSAKVRQPFSERFHRPRTGAKGVGRFATRRVARRLEMISTAMLDSKTPARGGERTIVTFNWAAFEPGKRISEVPATYRREEVHAVDIETGVRLRLLGLRDVWVAEDLTELHRDLLKLISPMPTGASTGRQNRDPGFSVEIRSEEFPEFSGDLGGTFLANALGVLEGQLSKNGTASYRLKFRGRRSIRFVPPRSKFPELGPSTFTIHFFIYKKDFFLGLPINTRKRRLEGAKMAASRFMSIDFVFRLTATPVTTGSSSTSSVADD